MAEAALGLGTNLGDREAALAQADLWCGQGGVAGQHGESQGPLIDDGLLDIGFTQQFELYEQLRAQGQKPVIIDSDDIRRDPERMMRSLCEAIGLPWTTAMLSWPTGGHVEDGVWAPHWYGAVHRSTGFAPTEGELPELTGEQAALAEEAMPFYRPLREMALL